MAIIITSIAFGTRAPVISRARAGRSKAKWPRSGDLHRRAVRVTSTFGQVVRAGPAGRSRDLLRRAGWSFVAEVKKRWRQRKKMGVVVKVEEVCEIEHMDLRKLRGNAPPRCSRQA